MNTQKLPSINSASSLYLSLLFSTSPSLLTLSFFLSFFLYLSIYLSIYLSSSLFLSFSIDFVQPFAYTNSANYAFAWYLAVGKRYLVNGLCCMFIRVCTVMCSTFFFCLRKDVSSYKHEQCCL